MRQHSSSGVSLEECSGKFMGAPDLSCVLHSLLSCLSLASLCHSTGGWSPFRSEASHDLLLVSEILVAIFLLWKAENSKCSFSWIPYIKSSAEIPRKVKILEDFFREMCGRAFAWQFRVSVSSHFDSVLREFYWITFSHYDDILYCSWSAFLSPGICSKESWNFMYTDLLLFRK